MEIIIFSPLITLRPRAEWRKRFFYFHSGGGGGDGVVLALGRFFRQGANLSLSRPLSPSSSSSFLRRVEILTLKCRGCGNREQTRLYFPIPRPPSPPPPHSFAGLQKFQVVQFTDSSWEEEEEQLTTIKKVT